jgi:hypothetical protein
MQLRNLGEEAILAHHHAKNNSFEWKTPTLGPCQNDRFQLKALTKY